MSLLDIANLDDSARRLTSAADSLAIEAERLTRASTDLDWTSATGSATRRLLVSTSGRVLERAEDLIGLAVQLRRAATEIHEIGDAAEHALATAAGGAEKIANAASFGLASKLGSLL